MARALLVGCGCRGRELGGLLIERGWAVRGTSRTDAGVRLIEAAGIEGAVADPAHPGTVFDLVADVTVLLWLMGSCEGEGEMLGAIHGPRLESLLEKLVDTPVRGLVYEASGSAPAELLEGGARLVEAASKRWRIPVAVLRSDPGEIEEWAVAACEAVETLLSR